MQEITLQTGKPVYDARGRSLPKEEVARQYAARFGPEPILDQAVELYRAYVAFVRSQPDDMDQRYAALAQRLNSAGDEVNLLWQRLQPAIVLMSPTQSSIQTEVLNEEARV